MPKNTRRSAIAGDLALVFAVALGFRLMWAVIIPPWATPDEPSHFTYVAHLAEQGELPHPPPYRHGYPQISNEVGASYQLFLLGRISRIEGPRSHDMLPYLPVDYDYRAVRAFSAPRAQRLTAAGASASDYPPLYYLIGAAFYTLFDESTLLNRLYAVRAVSALLGAFSCCFGYLLAYELKARRRRSWGRAVGASMALMPMHVFITASVNNDAGIFLCSTALCWLFVRALHSARMDARLAGAIGLVSGLALVTKPTGVSLVMFAGVLVLCSAFPVSRQPLRLNRSHLTSLSAFAAGVLLTAGPWVIFRITSAAAASTEATTDAALVQSLTGDSRYSFWSYLVYQQGLGLRYFEHILVTTYWGAFGWLDVYLSPGVYRIILGIYGLSGVGLIAHWIRRPRARFDLALLSMLIVVHIAFVFLVADFLLSYAATGASLGMQGRYFLPTLAPLLCLIVFGVGQLLRDHPLWPRLVPVGMLVLQLISLERMLSRYYGVGLL